MAGSSQHVGKLAWSHSCKPSHHPRAAPRSGLERQKQDVCFSALLRALPASALREQGCSSPKQRQGWVLAQHRHSNARRVRQAVSVHGSDLPALLDHSLRNKMPKADSSICLQLPAKASWETLLQGSFSLFPLGSHCQAGTSPGWQRAMLRALRSLFPGSGMKQEDVRRAGACPNIGERRGQPHTEPQGPPALSTLPRLGQH